MDRGRAARCGTMILLGLLASCGEDESPRVASDGSQAPSASGVASPLSGAQFLLDRLGEARLDGPWDPSSVWLPLDFALPRSRLEAMPGGAGWVARLPAAVQRDSGGRPLVARLRAAKGETPLEVLEGGSKIGLARLPAFQGVPRPPNALGQRRVLIREDSGFDLDLPRHAFMDRGVLVIGPGSGATGVQEGERRPQVRILHEGSVLAEARLEAGDSVRPVPFALPPGGDPLRLRLQFEDLQGRSGDTEMSLHGLELLTADGLDRLRFDSLPEGEGPLPLRVLFQPPSPRQLLAAGPRPERRAAWTLLDEGPVLVQLARPAPFSLWCDGREVWSTPEGEPRAAGGFSNPAPRLALLELRSADGVDPGEVQLLLPRSFHRRDPPALRGDEGGPLAHPMVRHLSLGRSTRRALILVAGSEVELPLHWAAGDRLQTALGLADIAGMARSADQLVVELSLKMPDGRRRGLGRAQVSPGSEWLPLELPLPGVSAEGASLHVRVLDPSGRPRMQCVVLGLAEPKVVPARPSQAPCVVFYLVDTLRADHLSCYGYRRPTSPNLDALAASGVLFEHAASQASWTKPSVASIFTGLLQSFHRAGKDTTLPPAATTLAEAFRAAGWTTAAFIANPYVHARGLNFEQGFGEFTATAEPLTAKEVVDEALPWIDSHQDQPFFLYLHTLDPHEPYQPPADTAGTFQDPAYDGPVRPEHTFAKTLRRGALDDADLQQVLDLYDEEILFNDRQFGRLLQHLDRRGLTERTWIVFVADHGEMFRTHQDYGHGRELWQELLHVPMVLRIPGGPQGLRIPDRVATTSLFATLATAFDLPLPRDTQGRDLRELFEGEGGEALVAAEEEPGMRAYLHGDHKLIERPGESGLDYQLFDLNADADEQRDLASRQPQQVLELRALLEARLRRDEEEGLRLPDGGREALDAAQRAALRALGYLGGEEGGDDGAADGDEGSTRDGE